MKQTVEIRWAFTVDETRPEARHLFAPSDEALNRARDALVTQDADIHSSGHLMETFLPKQTGERQLHFLYVITVKDDAPTLYYATWEGHTVSCLLHYDGVLRYAATPIPCLPTEVHYESLSTDTRVKRRGQIVLSGSASFASYLCTAVLRSDRVQEEIPPLRLLLDGVWKAQGTGITTR